MLSRVNGLRHKPLFLGSALKAATAAINSSQGRFASTDTEVTIGNVSKSYAKPKIPQYVPHKFLPAKKSVKALQHLRWMLQKDLLGQDMFLIGRPGPERRRLALEFLELTGREVEFVSLSRDTTEADLKQRRELRNGTAEFFDQGAVRAAVEGRILILEGVEKAERNVLPVLNNLLENREMHLEDGRFLVPAGRYDKLLKENSKEDLDRWRLVRVSEDFRVIALGLPVPRYPGNPLDPPLRSRFQARHVGTENFKDILAELQNSHPDADPTELSVLVSGCMALLSPEALSMSLPECPVSNLHAAAKLMGSMKGLPVHSALSRIYPYRLLVPPEIVSAVENMLTSLGVAKPKVDYSVHVKDVAKKSESGQHADVTVLLNGNPSKFQVPCGSGSNGSPSSPFVETAYQRTFLGELVQSHSAGDICIVGPRGCGKSATLLQLTSMFNYVQEPIVLYQDMTSRDLVQQRTTKPNGDTVWNNSPLVTAALEGNLAVLDGLHRIHPSTFSVIARLVQDRELQLHDGKRLIRHDRYDSLKETLGLSDEQLAASGVLRIHPSFRIVAISEKSKAGGDNVKSSWITSEMLSLFLFHEMRPLSSAEELKIIEELYGKASKPMQSVVTLADRLRRSEDASLRSISSSLSTRQLLRIARRMAAFPSNDVYSTVQRACLARFLPTVPRQALSKMLSNLGIESIEKVDANENKLTCSVVGDKVHIGNTVTDRYPDTAAKTKVPDILFFDVPQHIKVLEGLAQDFVLGEHLLLVGNQGVGKNKLADRLLQLLNRPREYIQLHRDTTVQTLTLQPTVRDGIVTFDDSPLVKAVKLGHVLMVDEADKAPTHVTCILKTLVESGEMILSDGRRIVPHTDERGKNPSSNIIPIHPDFRMIIMANRPGFPFLGNDFFGALGDLFSCHDIDNPSPESEKALLKSYGPDVPDELVQKLVRAFGELRSMADQELVTYPYSTREVVNIVRHLQEFPDEPLTSVVSNVFDFDRESSEVISTVLEVLHKHGIPVGAKSDKIALAPELLLPTVVHLGKWQQNTSESSDLMVSEKRLKLRPAVQVKRSAVPLDLVQVRSLAFTEMQSYCLIPIDEMGIVTSIAVAKGESGSLSEDNIFVSVSNPQSVIKLRPEATSGTKFQLEEILGSDFLRVKMLPLEDHLRGCVLIHEGKSNSLVVLDSKTGEASRILAGSFFEAATEKLSRQFSRHSKPYWSIAPLNSPNKFVVFENGAGHIAMVDLEEKVTLNTHVPINLQSLHTISSDLWILGDNDKNFWTMKKTSPSDPFPSVLTPLKTNFNVGTLGRIKESLGEPLPPEVLQKALGSGPGGPNRLFATDGTFASIAVNFPEEDGDGSPIFVWPRTTVKPPSGSPLILKQNGQIIRFCDDGTVPIEGLPKGENDDSKKPLLGYLEVVDVLKHNVRYIPVPQTQLSRLTAADYYTNLGEPLLLGETSGSSLVTVDKKGCMRLWETGSLQLARSLDAWQKLIGEDIGSIQVTVKRDSGASNQGPKHGKVDPLNEPHVGGNTWAGGTGGRDTAGLGGKGGPYRLDAGHTVHQISDEEKNAVPDHVKKAAQEMGRRAFSQRLREIQMSPYDASLYEQFYSNVRKQIQTLRVMLNSLQAKSKEREWVRHQTSGELDDTKLIEGLTGEKTIYKRRADVDPEVGAPQRRPKRVRLVVDVSGSMYRFNGYDKRLDREMEAVVLVMEAFQGFEERIKYDIKGHSGDGYGINFVDVMKQPANNKERLDIIKTMHAHAQFCMAGDHTLKATADAVSTLAEEDCDEAIVVLLSDANFERYRIPPQRFSAALTDNPNVNAYAIFIGSLGDQAERLKRQLPAGRAFICMDLKDIPQILQQIFAASMLNS